MRVYVDAVARAIICSKPEMKNGETTIVATLKSELPPATLRKITGNITRDFRTPQHPSFATRMSTPPQIFLL